MTPVHYATASGVFSLTFLLVLLPALSAAVLFLGGGSLPFLFDGAFVTLNADLGARAADLLGNAVVIPVHLNGWSHYTDTEDDVVQAFAGAGHDATLRLLAPGETYAA